jgi:hypothetical protein
MTAVKIRPVAITGNPEGQGRVVQGREQGRGEEGAANPYVGPRPFEPGERLWGRDDGLNQLEYLLKSDRIVLLHSPSGAGKSSLVQAGLLPQLRSSFDIWGPTRLNQEPPALDGHQDLNRYLLSAIQGFEEAVPERLRRALPVLAGQSLREYFEQRPRRRLIALYDVRDRPQKAADYRALLAAARAGTARAQGE